MLCDDQGLFLEIAQVIRRLDLTILKGVMVTRAGDTWAHFIVEVETHHIYIYIYLNILIW